MIRSVRIELTPYYYYKHEAAIDQNAIEEQWNASSLKSLVNSNHGVIERSLDEYTFYMDFDVLVTSFAKPMFDSYQHKRDYELLWCQEFCTRM